MRDFSTESKEVTTLNNFKTVDHYRNKWGYPLVSKQISTPWEEETLYITTYDYPMMSKPPLIPSVSVSYGSINRWHTSVVVWGRWSYHSLRHWSFLSDSSFALIYKSYLSSKEQTSAPPERKKDERYLLSGKETYLILRPTPLGLVHRWDTMIVPNYPYALIQENIPNLSSFRIFQSPPIYDPRSLKRTKYENLLKRMDPTTLALSEHHTIRHRIATSPTNDSK